MSVLVVQQDRIKVSRMHLQTPSIVVSAFHTINFVLIGVKLNKLSD